MIEMLLGMVFKKASTVVLSKASSIIQYVLLAIGILALVWLYNDYVDTKEELVKNKIEKKQIIEAHEKELIYIADVISERERQRSDLENHNKLLEKLNKRKSNVDTKAKTFKSRNITKFSF